jgi:hypothetical protein
LRDFGIRDRIGRVALIGRHLRNGDMEKKQEKARTHEDRKAQKLVERIAKKLTPQDKPPEQDRHQAKE